MELIKADLLPEYLNEVKNISEQFSMLKDAEISTDTFSFYTSVASVFSSKIEGEDIELDSYIKHKAMGMAFQPVYTKKTDDLYNAYLFAQNNALNESNLAKAHTLLAKNIVATNFLGKLRTNNMYITSENGGIDYIAISPYDLEREMNLFYADVNQLLQEKLTVEEVFYYAAYIHLVFVKIHPWNDGNGRTARLLEKWFIAQHLGPKAWFLQSERCYYQNHQLYYTNLRALGLEYPHLDYSKALPFLCMLPQSLVSK